MSERAMSFATLIGAVAAISVALPAQELELRTLRDSAARLDALVSARESSVKRIVDDRGRLLNAELRAAGVRVRYDSSAMSRDDLARLAAGIERGARAVEAIAGAQAPRLLADTSVWLLEGERGLRWLHPRIAVAIGHRFTQERWQLWRPIDPADVERIVLNRATNAMQGVLPATVMAFAGGNVPLRPGDTYFVGVARELATSLSTAGRRCATGVMAACRAVLTPPATQEAALAQWYEPADYRALAISVLARRPGAASGIAADSTFAATRRACLAGEATACVRTVTEGRVTDPFAAPRALLVAHVVERGGPAGIERMRAAMADSPLAILSAGAGVTEEALIAEWKARVVHSLAESRPRTAGVALSTALWCLLLLLGATRRRPE